MAKLTRQTLARIRADHREPENWIKVGMSTSGLAAGAAAVFEALRQGVEERGLEVAVKATGCVGVCSDEPLVEINVQGVPRTMYGNIDPDSAQWLLDAHVCGRRVVEKFVVPGFADLVRPEDDPPDAADPLGDPPRQYRIVLRNAGVIDPESFEDYVAADGYLAAERCLCELEPEQVIEVIKSSGLRGRGGAGFSTGLKWQLTREVPAKERFVICNGDEGDPGAYMDRSVLEDDPHAVIEGLLIAGYAIGAAEGIFYIRAEYPLAVDRVQQAIRQAKRQGLLGRDILGTGFNFDIDVRLGAGAFVCGEETALIASIEGQRGTPRPRPPFPSVKGLWGMPTSINNVETLANVPRIMLKGADWFRGIGTPENSGTKVFAVTGKVRHSGLIEVPMGTTLQAVLDLAGGSGTNKPIKAVQTGGPSGGVIPREHFDKPVGYESLAGLGSIMGSGGLIAMDEGDSMVDIARFYLGFCVEESCGRCAPCRIGGKQMLLLLEKISAGDGVPEDIATLEKICQAMKGASLCGLGQTAPNPVLSTLRYFRHEYEQAMCRPSPVSA
ncbi:MAG: SLBB domain-containing protein [Phycisphaeraceae bacterium]|nr:SLBB domain-containing protein [Phycisphaeraceae bacterium]